MHLKKDRDRVVPPGFTRKTVLAENMVRSLHHVAICLLGNSKGEGGANYHTINVVDESMSGLQMMWWVEKLVSIADQEGRSWGPAFANANGRLAVGSKFDTVFRKYLKQVQDKTSWISGDVNIDNFLSPPVALPESLHLLEPDV